MVSNDAERENSKKTNKVCVTLKSFVMERERQNSYWDALGRGWEA